MYVCLCTGATSEVVRNAVVGGASTCRQVAAACGAGTDCGRCWRTVRDIISSHGAENVRASHSETNGRASHGAVRICASYTEVSVPTS
jgi:bacterioferritin-associated ferredoxin